MKREKREMERVRMKSRKKRREAHAWAESEWVGGWLRGGGGAIDGKDERDGGKQQQHFSSLLKGLPSTTHDDSRQNGHPNKHQCSASDT